MQQPPSKPSEVPEDLTDEQVVQKKWIARVHVEEDGTFSECEEWCDDCFWYDHLDVHAIPEPVLTQAKCLCRPFTVSSKYGKVYTYYAPTPDAMAFLAKQPQVAELRAVLVKEAEQARIAELAAQERARIRAEEDAAAKIKDEAFKVTFAAWCAEFSVQFQFARATLDSVIEHVAGAGNRSQYGRREYIPTASRGMLGNLEVVQYDTSIYDWDMWGIRCRPADVEAFKTFLAEQKAREAELQRIAQEKWRVEQATRDAEQKAKQAELQAKIAAEIAEIKGTKAQILAKYADLVRKKVIMKSWSKDKIVAVIAKRIASGTLNAPAKPAPEDFDQEGPDYY